MAQAEAMLRLRARALCAVPAGAAEGAGAGAASSASPSSSAQWLAGTTALRDENELALFRFDGAVDRLEQVSAWLHADGEVWDVAVCPSRADRVATAHARDGAYGAALYAAEAGAAHLRPLARLLPLAGGGGGGSGGGGGGLDAAAAVVRRVAWSALDAAQLLTVQAGALRWWAVGADVRQQQEAVVAGGSGASGGCNGGGGCGALWAADLHPTQPQLAAAAADGGLFLYDARQLPGGAGEAAASAAAAAAASGAAPHAHALATRSVSWAPRNEHRLATGGDDGWLRYWDTRLLRRPVLQLPAHSHWVWDVRFSPLHDQLLLTASSDATAALWFTPALARRRGAPSADDGDGDGGSWDAAGSPGSSAGPSPAKSAGAGGGATAAAAQQQQQRPASRGGGGDGAADGRALLVDDHEEAVHRVAWGSGAGAGAGAGGDPWVFATLSYDGRLAVSRVPRGVKYKVLI